MKEAKFELSFEIAKGAIRVKVAGTVEEAVALKASVSTAMLQTAVEQHTEFKVYMSAFSMENLIRVRELIRAVFNTAAKGYILEDIYLVWQNGPDRITIG